MCILSFNVVAQRDSYIKRKKTTFCAHIGIYIYIYRYIYKPCFHPFLFSWPTGHVFLEKSDDSIYGTVSHDAKADDIVWHVIKRLGHVVLVNAAARQRFLQGQSPLP